jgi:Skp family chaperone for outer membrane proteins
MRFIQILMMAIVIMVAGCTTPLLMVPSSTPLDGRTFEVAGSTEGESCYANILGIPLSRDASLHAAVREARLKVNAEALIDVVVDSWSLYTFFFNKRCTVVHANGIRFTGQAAPYLEPAPRAIPKTEPAAPPKEEAAVAKVPAQPVEKKKSQRELARERRKAEREAKKQAALEKKRKAEEEKRKAAEAGKKAEEEKKRQEELAKKKAEEEKREALQKRRAEEEAKPVPDQYKVFCKYKKGDNVRVETKAQVIEAEFVKCVYFGMRVIQKEKGVGVIPFEQIWVVKKIVPVEPKTEPKTEPAKPADPKTPAAPKTPAKP